jgi:hypothetical protein
MGQFSSLWNERWAIPNFFECPASVFSEISIHKKNFPWMANHRVIHLIVCQPTPPPGPKPERIYNVPELNPKESTEFKEIMNFQVQ